MDQVQFMDTLSINLIQPPWLQFLSQVTHMLLSMVTMEVTHMLLSMVTMDLQLLLLPSCLLEFQVKVILIILLQEAPAHVL